MDITPVQRVDSITAVTPTLSPQEVAQSREIITAVQAVNKSEMLGQGAELTFLRDRDTKRLVIQLVDPTTREVIRQIPPEYVLEAAQQLFAHRKKDTFE